MTNIPRKQPGYTAHWEGYRGHLYTLEGIPHIGYGHVVGLKGWTSPIHDLTMHNDYIPEPLAKMILQYDLEQAVLRLMDVLGPEVWRSMDGYKWEVLDVSNRSLRFEVSEASPRQIVLMDWCLNTGGGSMPGFVAAVKERDWVAAYEHLLWVDPFDTSTDSHTDYYLTRQERAELNAAVILGGEWPGDEA